MRYSYSYVLTGTGDPRSYNHGKNSHSGIILCRTRSQHRRVWGLDLKGHREEEGGHDERRPRTNVENGALGEHRSDEDGQMGLGRK